MKTKDEETSNLRLLPVARDDDSILGTDSEPGKARCQHRKGRLDEAAHRLFCRDCGAEVDPFAFLLRMTLDRQHWRREGESLHAKYGLAARELAEVERKLKNAKARLRNRGVLLSTTDARRARDQLRALGRALTNLLREIGETDEDALKKAKERARLCGYRDDDMAKALAALKKGLDG